MPAPHNAHSFDVTLDCPFCGAHEMTVSLYYQPAETGSRHYPGCAASHELEDIMCPEGTPCAAAAACIANTSPSDDDETLLNAALDALAD